MAGIQEENILGNASSMMTLASASNAAYSQITTFPEAITPAEVAANDTARCDQPRTNYQY